MTVKKVNADTEAQMARMRARLPGKWTYRALGQHFGVSPEVARMAVKRAMKHDFTARQCEKLDAERRASIERDTAQLMALAHGGRARQ